MRRRSIQRTPSSSTERSTTSKSDGDGRIPRSGENPVTLYRTIPGQGANSQHVSILTGRVRSTGDVDVRTEQIDEETAYSQGRRKRRATGTAAHLGVRVARQRRFSNRVTSLTSVRERRTPLRRFISAITHR